MSQENNIADEIKDESIQDNNVEEQIEIVDEIEEETYSDTKVAKTVQAKKIIEETKSIVEVSDGDTANCKQLLENDIRDYERARKALYEGGLRDVRSLLSKLGHTKIDEGDQIEEEVVIFEAQKDENIIKLKDVSSGRFSALILALLAGVSTFMGLVYVATEKMNMVLDITKIPSNDKVNEIGATIATLVGLKEDFNFGAIVSAVAVLLVMFIVYKLRVGLKSGSNLRFANKQMENAQNYITDRTNCKIEMEKVDLHITEAIQTLADYQVVLNEQHAKLVRIKHFEGTAPSLTSYHSKSVEEMNYTQYLVENISSFVIKPMSDDGKLSDESASLLANAKETMKEALKRFI
ncbi:MAG: ORF 73 extensive acidic domains, potential leucine zipper immediate early protein homolog [uncultured Sulfurovum sp.]|uniref:ORF 73 extensive acidic domains, potential leucine zipper immediate early protein homolog n=1 Tax=uncultured Sulfurovum sp. TaxID=269237 RepID=A0A6S6UGP6_9BACT|nr:MAG: ORF 73 extensive acidic domains, potential leucine zipper immediate early protein homolog [uncultured Sulfurovum sp.]